MVESSRKPLRVLHTSDLHLGSLGDVGCHNFEAVIASAIKNKVDLVIIAGDFFNHNGVDDNLVSFVVEHLRCLPVYVLILPGNHDCLTSDSVYHRERLWSGAANIQIFKAREGEMFTFPSLGVSVWGKPIDSDESKIRPLAGIPRPQENEHWHIAVAHGYYFSNIDSLFLSYHITPEEIVVLEGWDYIALGHIDTFRCVRDEPMKAYYCGSPSLTGTVTIVDLVEKTGVQVTPYSL